MARVLVVDDALFMRASIKQMLERNGHSVAGEAGNGLQALEVYQNVNPDVVMLDLTMPEMNGLEALEKLKQINPAVKVIICTALGQREMVARAIELGATEFIVKPFEEDRLMKAIQKVCG